MANYRFIVIFVSAEKAHISFDVLSPQRSENFPHFLNYQLSDSCEIVIENNQKKINVIIVSDNNELQTLNPFTFWYRKRYLSKYQIPDIPNLITNKEEIYNNIYFEIKDLEDYIYEKIIEASKGRSISNPFLGNVNKLSVLDKAQKLGIQIPNFLITTSKKKLEEFINANKKVIIKPISNVITIRTDNINYLQYTRIISNKFLATLPNSFFPGFFQQYIDKKFEVRTFFLDGRFYSMAMFTQSNKKTKIDFRKYDYIKPNRNVPFKLPKQIEKKLSNLFTACELNSGSIDLIYSRDNNFYFLEINPVGQFGMVSLPCNYYLEKEIASKICNYETKIISE